VDTNTSLEWRHAKDPSVLWATALGVGFARPAPGTWGSIAAVVFWWWLLAPLAVGIQLLICVGYFLTGWWASQRVCQSHGVEDASEIVADEVAGMWLALAAVSVVYPVDAPVWIVLFAFVVFRLFDILKPGPIGWLDRELHGGLGIMADDMVAGAVTGGLVVCVYQVSVHVFGG